MRLKNVSLLYLDNWRPRLLPAKDLVSTAAYTFEGFDELALTLDGSRKLDPVTPDAVRSMARRVGASEADVVEVARHRTSPTSFANSLNEERFRGNALARR